MNHWKNRLISIFSETPIARSFGMQLSFDGNKAIIDLPYNPQLDNPFGIHGGVIATILDSAGFFACASSNEGVWLTTSEFKIHLLEFTSKERLTGVGTVVKNGKRLSIAEVKVFNERGKICALGTGTFVPLNNIDIDRL